jgi:hypothetical protein
MIKGFILLFLLNENPLVLAAPHTFDTVQECLQEGDAVAPVLVKEQEEGVVVSYLIVCGVTSELVEVGEEG